MAEWAGSAQSFQRAVKNRPGSHEGLQFLVIERSEIRCGEMAEWLKAAVC